MSFKREGDDLALLDDLKRRRVSELLATNIPANEARLLKNGRYTCTVCTYGPIFDTLDILAIHRKGKKHLTSLSAVLTAKQNRNEVATQSRNHYPDAINQNPQLQQVMKMKPVSLETNTKKYHSLLKAEPYKGYRKRRCKPSDRKVMIDLRESAPDTLRNETGTSCSKRRAEPANSAIKIYLKSIQHKESFEGVVKKSRSLCNLGPVAPPSTTTTSEQENRLAQHAPPADSSWSEEQRIKANHYLNLRRDGWKRDADGQWIKDEQAEFDSDEELPPEL